MRLQIVCMLFSMFLVASYSTAQKPKKEKVQKPKKIEGCMYGPIVTKGDFPLCSHDAWVLEFEDEFDGKRLNTSVWKVPHQGILAGFDFESGGSKQWYANTGNTPTLPLDRNILVEDGVLKLIAQREENPIEGIYVTDWSSTPPNQDTSVFEYSSAWLESEKLYGYGYYEARCKLPKGKGMWPAFWLFNGEDGLNYEIDIFEFWNESSCMGSYDSRRLSKNPHLNIHSNNVMFPHDITCPTDFYKPCQSWPETGFDDAFHTFGLEWDFYQMIWYIDGEKVRTAYRFVDKKGNPITCGTKIKKPEELLEAYFWPYTEKMDVRFNLGVQYNKRNEPEKSDIFPQTFEIDYFRFYKQPLKEKKRV